MKICQNQSTNFHRSLYTENSLKIKKGLELDVYLKKEKSFCHETEDICLFQKFTLLDLKLFLLYISFKYCTVVKIYIGPCETSLIELFRKIAEFSKNYFLKLLP